MGSARNAVEKQKKKNNAVQQAGLTSTAATIIDALYLKSIPPFFYAFTKVYHIYSIHSL